MNLLPKDPKFFELFTQHATLLARSSELLNTGLEGGLAGVSAILPEMDVLERSGDEIVHQLFNHLRSTFITPFDPEDIGSLATNLDEVLDAIEDVAFRIAAYRLEPIPQDAVRLGHLIDESVKAICRALVELEAKRPVVNAAIEINRLENEADAVERSFIARLFSEQTNPITLLKEKEIVEALERTTDLCENVADVIENVSVKNI